MKHKDRPQSNDSTITSEKPLQSWKEIAAYLEIGERTARRWEESAALPVRRHGDGKRSGVYAYPSELDAWRAARKPKASQIHLRRWSVAVAIGALSILLGTWFVLYSPVFDPPNPLVEAADGITLRQVWVGPAVDDKGDISSDGKLLTYTDWDTGNLAIRDLDSEENRRVTEKGTWAESDEYAEVSIISPNGRQIAYGWYNEDGRFELRLLDLNRSKTRILYRCEKGGWVRPIDWMPDGERILVGLYRNDRGELALLSVSDGAVRAVVASSTLDPTKEKVEVALSPDGKHIVYERKSEGKSDQRDLFTIPTNGGESFQLVDHPADDYSPIWSPDGRYVIFASDRTASTGLWMVRVENGRPTDKPQLVKSDLGPLRNLIGWTRQVELYFSLGAGMEDIYFFEMDPSNGAVLKQPSKLAGRHVGANMGPRFSPDGQYVAYQFQHAPNAIGPGALTLVVRSLRTGKEKEIRTSLIQHGPVQWFPDGKSVLVPALRSMDNRITDYYRMDLESGQTELIRKADRKMHASYQPYLSTNGKQIFFTDQRLGNSTWSPAVFKRFDIGSGKEYVIHRIPDGKKVRSIVLSPDEQNIAWAQWSDEPGHWGVCTKPVKGGTTREVLTIEMPGILLAYGSVIWTPDGQHLLVSKFSRDGLRSELLRLSLNGDEPSTLGIIMDRILFADIHRNKRLVAFGSGQQKGRGKEIWAMGGFLPTEVASN